MPQFTLLYGSPTAVNISLDGLAGSTAQQSDMIDNTVDLYTDVLVQMTIAYPNVSPSGQINLYFAASQDGVTFDGTGTTGTDGLYSGSMSDLYQLYQSIVYPVQNSISRAGISINWGPGYIPPYYAFIVENATSDTLDVGCSLSIIGVKSQGG